MRFCPEYSIKTQEMGEIKEKEVKKNKTLDYALDG